MKVRDSGFGSGRALAALVLVVGLFGPAAALAEAFVELSLGAAISDDDEVSVHGCTLAACPTPGFSFDTSFEESVSASLRGGAWFDGASWLGLGVGLSVFTADIEGAQLTNGKSELVLVPFSLFAELRVPIATGEHYPSGRVQPYLAVGPAFVLSVLSLEGEKRASEFQFGADLRSGIRVMVTPWLGVFSEYRYTHIPVDFDSSLEQLDATLKTELNTHHASVGLTFAF